jgi:hypothetical protein
VSVPNSADLVIDMVDDAMAAYEPDDFALIKDFSTGVIRSIAPVLNLPGRDYLHDGRPEKYPALHALHHGRPIP